MEFLTQISPQSQLIMLILFGLASGSFVSLLSYRLVSKEAIFFGRSRCPLCKTKLKIRSLFPVFSWLIQKGKCLDCHQKISWRYPLIELFCSLGFVLTYFAIGAKINFQLLIYLAIFTVLVAMIVVDLEHYFIPDILQFILAFLVAILVIHNGGVSSIYKGIKPALIFVAFGFAVWIFFYYSAGIDGLGIDDFKFFLIAGFMLGMENFVLFMFLSGILGAFFGTLWQKIKKDETFPFAPAICLSAYICLLVGKPIIY